MQMASFLGIKFETGTPLQLQVAALRVCSKCHKKTLVERCCDETYLWMQCTKCHTVFLPALREVLRATATDRIGRQGILRKLWKARCQWKRKA